MENVSEVICFRYLLQLRSRIRDSDETAASFIRAHSALYAFKEVLFENIWFQRTSRFAGDNEQRFCKIYFLLECLDLSGIGGIKNIQLGIARNPTEGEGKHLGTQARSAHAQHQYIAESFFLNFFRDTTKFLLLPELLFCNVEPA